MIHIRAVASNINDGIASQAESACKHPISVATVFCPHLETATAAQPPVAAVATASQALAAVKAVQ